MKVRVTMIISAIGVILAIIGWLIGNNDRISFINKIVAPNHVIAKQVLSKMYKEGFLLTRDSEGFSQISKILQKNIKGDVEPEILSIKTKTWGQGFVNTAEGMKTLPFIDLEITFTNAQPLGGHFHDIGKQIDDEYHSTNIFIWSTTLFWLGIILSILGLLLKTAR